MSEKPKDTRTPAEVEAELEQLRADLSDSVNELVDKLNPVNHLNDAKDNVSAAISHAGESAKHAAAGLGAKAQGFAERLRHGEPQALAALGAGLAATAAVVTVAVRRSR